MRFMSHRSLPTPMDQNFFQNKIEMNSNLFFKLFNILCLFSLFRNKNKFNFVWLRGIKLIFFCIFPCVLLGSGKQKIGICDVGCGEHTNLSKYIAYLSLVSYMVKLLCHLNAYKIRLIHSFTENYLCTLPITDL